MTDLELNIAIVEAMEFEFDSEKWNGDIAIIKSGAQSKFNFLNWSGVMPLCVKYGIVYHKVGVKNVATTQFGEHESSDEVLQRALAECLLKVLKEQMK